jgi:putative PEP-CTERM system histidine kinase
MLQLIVDVSATLSIVAGMVGGTTLVRTRSVPSWVRVLGLPYVFLAALMVVVSLYVRSPFSLLRVRLVVTALCLAPAPWLLATLTLSELDVATALARWRAALVVQAASSALAAVMMWAYGVDWITGIASEPAVVFGWWGLVAIAISSVPACAGLAILARRFSTDAATMPVLWVSAVGVICSLMWIAAASLWHGYLSVSLLRSAGALGGVSAAVGAVGLLQAVSVSYPLAPSRRLIYGASAATLVAAYLIVARFALGWIADFAATAIPEIFPVTLFVTAGGLVVTLGSPRWRHRLWVAVGQHFFRTKHDYGEAWIRLTELVSTAQAEAVLLRHTAAFCRNLLCVSETSIWLTDAAGGLRRIATASAATPSGRIEETDHRVVLVVPLAGAGLQLKEGIEDAALARATAASFACPMLVNGRILGVLAVSAADPVVFDEEDRRVLRHVAAQVASALGLYRLGEEIAEAREVRSLDRLSTFVLHDLKNLVAQQSFVLENAKTFGSDVRFVADAMAAFEDSTNRMQALIQRLHAKKPGFPTTGKQCDLLAVVQHLLAKPQLLLRAGGRVHLKLPSEVDACVVPVDRTDLTQVFTNLLLNAVESLKAGNGDITVTVAPVTAGWELEVRDTGCGIPASFLHDKLFRAFRTTKQGGLGIGLYQCKTIVEASGGSITVTSQEQIGTTVTVVLPALLQPQEPAYKDVEYG